MSYKYMNAYASISTKTPKENFVDLFQENVNEEFAVASDVWVIQEETPFGSGEYEDVEVRVLTHIVTSETGEKNGDDYKKILFKDITHATSQGYMYYFDNNYWLVSQADKIKNLAASCVVRRCNNVLRWLDLNGGYHEIPVAINEIIKENRDYSTAGSSLVIPAAQLECLVQFNSYTNLIEPNQRFLFGNASNWHGYKVLGGGVNNYNLLQTSNNLSAGVIRLSLGANYVNLDTDDLVNGICDVHQTVYVLTIDDSTVSGNAGNTRQLSTTITLNDVVVTRSVLWTTSDSAVATVSSTGLLTMVANGTCTITATLVDNDDVYGTSAITVISGSVSDYVVISSPNTNYVLEKETQVYTVYLYLNGVVQGDTFTFSLNPNTITSTYYTYTAISGNSFSIKNNAMFLGDTLDIACTSGTHSKIMSVVLKGAW